MGMAQYKKGDFIDAINTYGQAIALEPKSAKPHFHKGMAYEKMNRDKKAISSYNTALELNEKHTKSYNRLGALFEKINQHENAVEAYRQSAYWGDVTAKQWGLDHGFNWL